jgi:hypothetical protein
VLQLWPALLRDCDVGAIEINNSAAGRGARGVAIVRSNYLCAGASCAGVGDSLIGTAGQSCRIQGRGGDVLAHLAAPPVNRVDHCPFSYCLTQIAPARQHSAPQRGDASK